MSETSPLTTRSSSSFMPPSARRRDDDVVEKDEALEFCETTLLAELKGITALPAETEALQPTKDRLHEQYLFGH